MTTKEEIRGWLTRGKAKGASHVAVRVDWFDHEDYPVFVEPGQDALTEARGSQDRVMEIYDLSMDWDTQLNEFRAWHP